MNYNIGITLLIIGVGILIWGLRSIASDNITERLYIYLGGLEKSDMDLPTKPQRQRPQLSGTFQQRVLIPIILAVSRLLSGLTPGRLSDKLEKQLAIAGNPLGMGPRDFYVIRIIFTLAGIVLSFMILQSDLYSVSDASSGMLIPVTGSELADPTTIEHRVSLTGVLISLLTLIIIANLPRTWLRRRARIRNTSILKSLPDALDMLSICSDAGLGFDQSLLRVSNSWDNTLAREFGRVVTEMGMGVSRKTALRNLADRTSVPELSSFVSVILQSDQLGMSITQTLHAQAKQMRIERRFRAQEQARRMPLMMLFPLILLIFPAMFAVILGPMVPVISDLFSILRR